MVHREDRQRRGEPIVAKRQLGRGGLHDRRASGAPLADHRHRGLDGDDRAIRWLVGAGAGSYVHDGFSLVKRARDRRGQTRIGAAMLLVADPDLVVELRHPEAQIDQAKVNMGTDGPPSVGLKTTFTRWPMRMASRSQSTMFVIIVTPSSRVT